MAARAFLGIDNFKINSHPCRDRGEVPIAIHLRFCIGQSNATVPVVVSDRIICIVAKVFVQIDRVRFQTDHHLGHAKIGDLRSRVPSRAGGQFVTFDQHDIGPTFLRQMIQGRTASYATTNYDYSCLITHLAFPQSDVLTVSVTRLFWRRRQQECPHIEWLSISFWGFFVAGTQCRDKGDVGVSMADHR